MATQTKKGLDNWHNNWAMKKHGEKITFNSRLWKDEVIFMAVSREKTLFTGKVSREIKLNKVEAMFWKTYKGIISHLTAFKNFYRRNWAVTVTPYQSTLCFPILLQIVVTSQRYLNFLIGLSGVCDSASFSSLCRHAYGYSIVSVQWRNYFESTYSIKIGSKENQ